MWEQLQEQSRRYDPSSANCHHFARHIWNWAVEAGWRTTELPWATSEAALVGVAAMFA